MLGFTLSKLNLLILVVAMFSIVSFFMFGLSDIMKVSEAEAILSRLSKKSYALVASPSYCDSVYYILPESINILGSDFKYDLKISTEDALTEDNEPITYVIFSIFPRKKDTALAAESFKTKAQVYLFDSDGLEVQVGPTVLDPQAARPIDALTIIKEIRQGEEHLYIIPCGSGKGLCEVQKTNVGVNLFGEEGFNC